MDPQSKADPFRAPVSLETAYDRCFYLLSDFSTSPIGWLIQMTGCQAQALGRERGQRSTTSVP